MSDEWAFWTDGSNDVTWSDMAHWCHQCGALRHSVELSWEVDVNRDGPAGPEYPVVTLDCEHQVVVGPPRAQRWSR